MKGNILSVGIAVIALVLASWKFFSEEKRIGYVDIKQVFNEFDMKKELESALETNLKERKKTLDSLTFLLQSKSEIAKTKEPTQEWINEFQLLQQTYYNEKQFFDQYNQETIEKSNNQIITQMTQYIKDFGQKEGFSFILGSNENGNVLYGNEGSDISKEVIEYINKSYQGKVD